MMVEYTVLTSYWETSDFSMTSNLLRSYCRNLRAIPATPRDLINYAFSAQYHPNDLIVDDFEIEDLRLNVDETAIILYFVGPDDTDDKLNLEIDRNLKGLKYAEYLKLKGDFILGYLDIGDAKFYIQKR